MTLVPIPLKTGADSQMFFYFQNVILLDLWSVFSLVSEPCEKDRATKQRTPAWKWEGQTQDQLGSQSAAPGDQAASGGGSRAAGQHPQEQQTW